MKDVKNLSWFQSAINDIAIGESKVIPEPIVKMKRSTPIHVPIRKGKDFEVLRVKKALGKLPKDLNITVRAVSQCSPNRIRLTGNHLKSWKNSPANITGPNYDPNREPEQWELDEDKNNWGGF